MHQTACFIRQPLIILEQEVSERMATGVVCSLGLVLYDCFGRVLMVRENHGNRIKNEGDYSIPWETWERGKSLETMRQQACDEEIGERVVHATPTILFSGLLVAGTMATILTARFVSADHLRGTAVATGELKEPGAVWMDPRWFLAGSSGALLSPSPLPTRLGIREILEAFIKKL